MNQEYFIRLGLIAGKLVPADATILLVNRVDWMVAVKPGVPRELVQLRKWTDGKVAYYFGYSTMHNTLVIRVPEEEG